MDDAPRLIDVEWAGRPGEIGAWLCGDVLVDCGPTSSLERLLAGLGDVEPRALLLTHIHLDHAGAAGSLVERWPDLEVYVHPIGLPHLADPERLVRSATRIYGDAMDSLWGPIVPVPERNLRPVGDGERIGAFVAAHTPGHASHHVAYFRPDGGEAFPGDATGVRLDGSDLVIPHAPPPDIDVEAWDRSLDAIAAWHPDVLCLPHFGPIDGVEAHVDSMREAVHRKAELARTSDLDGFVAAVEAELAALGDPALAEHYRNASPIEHSYLGLRRYWDKREEA
ncbi:MAG TPA: MBL fold metallo-hydrolase [Gaiellaceae bacterium]|nr:MBL fold metallo-hydrolase [Gaiellaceae bacterium]